MAGKSVSKRKLTFFIFFLTYCGQGHMLPPDLQVLNIDQIGQEILNNPDIIMNIFLSNDSISDDSISSKYDMVRCANELNSIMESLRKLEIWPIKLLDSWGRIPSGILSGNLNDFGDFRRCFHIDRNGETYQTQYCLGQIIVDFNAFLTPDYLRKNAEPQYILEMFEFKNKTFNKQISTDEGLKVGICLPDICSPLFIAQNVNSLIIEMNISNIQIEIPENTCQFEEKITQINTLDMVAIILLVIAIFLMILSTCYDIWCASNNLPNSQTLTAFSVYTNCMKLFSCKTDRSGDIIQCLNGIRTISTLWIVLSHNFMAFVMLPMTNGVDLRSFMEAYSSMLLMNNVLAVDTFLLLSGLLISIKLFRKMEKTQCCNYIPMLYVHRYLKLTPTLAITILFSITLLPFLGNGPLWPNLMLNIKGQCLRNWWTSFLYVQNYLHSDDICLLHTWYLAVDTQLYILAPFLIQLIYLFKFKAIFALTLSILACIGYTIATYIKNDLTLISDVVVRSVLTYFPTHTRFMPWMIGIFLGYILHKMRNKTIRIPTMYNALGWIISITLLITVLFANHSMLLILNSTSPFSNGLYESLSRLIWPSAVGYIIFACAHNHGGPVNWFLSHPFWQPISNLSYTIYLIHVPVIIMFQGAMKSVPYFSWSMLFHTFLANCMVSIIISVFIYLAFGAPLFVIQNAVFPRDSDCTLEASQNEIQIKDGKYINEK